MIRSPNLRADGPRPPGKLTQALPGTRFVFGVFPAVRQRLPASQSKITVEPAGRISAGVLGVRACA